MRVFDPNAQVAPLWPPLLAVRGPGSASAGHAHHAMHLVLALRGTLSIRAGGRTFRGAGVLTAPDVPHALDARGVDVLLVFVDPESEVGASLRAALSDPVRVVSPAERRAIDPTVAPAVVMGAGGPAWTARVASVLGDVGVPPKRTIHPRVRRILARLRAGGIEDTSLEALAREAGLSPSRLMHVFTESIGIPLRPYLAWLRLQRAAAAIAGGRSLTEAAAHAGFSDSAHMSRSFRRAFGMAPSGLRAAQPVPTALGQRPRLGEAGRHLLRGGAATEMAQPVRSSVGGGVGLRSVHGKRS